MFKNIKFEKSKYPIIPICFWVILVFSFLSILNILISNYYKFDIKNLTAATEPVSTNLELKRNFNPNSFFVCYDNNCQPFDNKLLSKVYTSRFNFGYEYKDGGAQEDENKAGNKIKNIYLAYPISNKDFKNSINNIDIHVGNKKIYYENKDISLLKNKSVKMELSSKSTKEKEIKEYNTILLYDKSNYRGIFNNLCILFLSLFYNWQIFVIPLFWLFAAILIYQFKKDEIKLDKFFDKINNFIETKTALILVGITILGAILRINGINYHPLWNDEVFVKTIAIKDFLSCFSDPGNPPFFFILEYLFTRIFGTSDIALRTLPYIFGVALIPLIYLLFKNISKKLALFASFMMAINTISMYYSIEARGYTLFMFLGALMIILLFNYLKNPNKKNLIYYSLTAAIAINSYYYLVIIVFCNFIWGVVDLIQNKNKNQILPFLIGNIIAALTFAPYLIITYKNSFNSGFNGWIQPLTSDMFLYAIKSFFINKYIFLILCLILLFNLVILFIKKEKLEKFNIKISPEKENLIIYLVYTIITFLIVVSAISLGIKPIFQKRLLMSLYTFLFSLEMLVITGVFDFIKQNKMTKTIKIFYCTILLLTFFVLTKPMPVKYFCRLDNFMHFIEHNAPNYSKDYEIHAITVDNSEYLKNYPEVEKMDYINWHYVNVNDGRNIVDLDKYLSSLKIDKNKKNVIYSHGIAVYTGRAIKNNPKIDIFYTNSTENLKYIY